MLKKITSLLAVLATIAWASEITFVPYAQAKSHIGNGKPVMLEVGTKSCAGCKAMHVVLEPFVKAHPHYQIYYVNVDEKLGKKDILSTRQRKTVGDTLVIGGYPVQVFYDGSGKEVYRHAGPMTAAQLQSVTHKLGF